MSTKKRYRRLVERALAAGLFIDISILYWDPQIGDSIVVTEKSRADRTNLDAIIDDLTVYVAKAEAQPVLDEFDARWQS